LARGDLAGQRPAPFQPPFDGPALCGHLCFGWEVVDACGVVVVVAGQGGGVDHGFLDGLAELFAAAHVVLLVALRMRVMSCMVTPPSGWGTILGARSVSVRVASAAVSAAWISV